MLRKLLGAACALVIAAAPAEAQWKYDFSGTFMDDGFAVTYQFVLFAPTPPVSGQVAPTSCDVTSANPLVFYQCEPPGPGLEQDGFGTGVSLVDAKFQKFNIGDVDPSGGGGAFFWFEPAAFFTPGVYTRYDNGVNPSISKANPDFGNPNCPEFTNCTDETLYYGSAGEATLTVSNATPGGTSLVPEPSTYLLTAAGLAGLGVAAHRRRTSR